MTRRKTHYAANARLALGNEQSLAKQINPLAGNATFQCGEIVLEDKSIVVRGVFRAASADVSRAQITFRIVGWALRSRCMFSCSLPWTLCAMRRNQHPFARQRIESSMRIFRQSQVSSPVCKFPLMSHDKSSVAFRYSLIL